MTHGNNTRGAQYGKASLVDSLSRVDTHISHPSFDILSYCQSLILLECPNFPSSFFFFPFFFKLSLSSTFHIDTQVTF